MKLTELIGPDGSKIYIEQEDDLDTYNLQAVGFVDDIEERTKKFKDMLKNSIQNYSAMLITAIKDGSEKMTKPDSVALEFGMQISGESGIPFITKGTAQANVKVNISWNLKNPPEK